MLTLRPFQDNDIPIFEKWLAEPHVARWYEQPDHWLREIRGRRGEFDFITHFIAEIDGVAMGFCQYYDCYQSQAYEEWGRSFESPNEVYSIDYLIGEEKYLRKGYGGEIVHLLGEMVFGLGAKQIIVDPDRENIASNKALETNGFKHNGSYYIKEMSPAENYTREELEEAGRAIASVISKCEKAQKKPTLGKSQQTLLKRRLRALQIASALIRRELAAYSGDRAS